MNEINCADFLFYKYALKFYGVYDKFSNALNCERKGTDCSLNWPQWIALKNLTTTPQSHHVTFNYHAWRIDFHWIGRWSTDRSTLISMDFFSWYLLYHNNGALISGFQILTHLPVQPRANQTTILLIRSYSVSTSTNEESNILSGPSSAVQYHNNS